jgi:SAM-dependent methyltransferase
VNPQNPSDELAFDRKATSYDTHAHVQRDTAAWVAEWLPLRHRPLACLEFGAGTGNFTRHLARVFSNLEASDHAAAMVATARQAFPEITWTQRDAWNPPDAPASWDYVSSCSLLQWAEDPVRVLQAWRTLLRPGGRVLSGIYIAPSLPEFACLLPGRVPFPWRSADQWQKSFEAAGFAKIRVESCGRDYVYPSARALLRQLHGTGAFRLGEPLPVGELRAFIRDYERRFGRPGGVVSSWTFCRIEGVA